MLTDVSKDYSARALKVLFCSSVCVRARAHTQEQTRLPKSHEFIINSQGGMGYREKQSGSEINDPVP